MKKPFRKFTKASYFYNFIPFYISTTLTSPPTLIHYLFHSLSLNNQPFSSLYTCHPNQHPLPTLLDTSPDSNSKHVWRSPKNKLSPQTCWWRRRKESTMNPFNNKLTLNYFALVFKEFIGNVLRLRRLAWQVLQSVRWNGKWEVVVRWNSIKFRCGILENFDARSRLYFIVFYVAWLMWNLQLWSHLHCTYLYYLTYYVSNIWFWKALHFFHCYIFIAYIFLYWRHHKSSFFIFIFMLKIVFACLVMQLYCIIFSFGEKCFRKQFGFLNVMSTLRTN